MFLTPKVPKVKIPHTIKLVSFGYKKRRIDYTDADNVYDVSFMSDDFEPTATGLDLYVQGTIRANYYGFIQSIAKTIIWKCENGFLDRGILVMVGCDWGKHRSVAVVEILAQILTGKGLPVVVEHRNLPKGYA